MWDCRVCGRRWTGRVECHCPSSELALLTLWNRDAVLASQLDAVALQRPPDGRRVRTGGTSYLLSAPPLPVEIDERSRVIESTLGATFLARPGRHAVGGSMFGGGQENQIRWGVVGFDAVQMVDMLIRTDSTRNDSVFIRFDVASEPDLPAEPDVSVRRHVSEWWSVRACLARRQSSDVYLPPTLPAVSAHTLLRCAGDQRPAVGAWLADGHAAMIVQWSCCNHFGSPSAFARHLRGDRCLTGGELVAPTRNGKPRLVPVQRIHGTVWVLSSRT